MTQVKKNGRDPNECPSCDGLGQDYTAPTIVNVTPEGKHKTVQLGSGCMRCLGLGRLPK